MITEKKTRLKITAGKTNEPVTVELTATERTYDDAVLAVG